MYKAKLFYKKQQDGEVLQNARYRGKLYKDDKGFYVYQKSRKEGQEYNKKYITGNTRVYSRTYEGEGKVSIYEPSRDRNNPRNPGVRGVEESIFEHSDNAHRYDRVSRTGKKTKV